MRSIKFLACWVLLLVGVINPVAVSQQQDAFFENRIRPLFIEHCFECHGADMEKLRGGLDLGSPMMIHMGGDGGPVVVPGNPEESLLFVAVSYADQDLQMPPAGKLSAREIEDIRKWIQLGAPMPEVAEEDLLRARAAGDEAPYDWEAARTHWAYQPMGHPEIPAVSDASWCRNEIDHFVLARLEEAGLAPAPEADKRTLIRRAYFDLIGLPPSPEEVDRFLADDSPESFSRMVDELLMSPHYGERWGRHWLDVARYADSNGLDENTAFGNAWRYRDWVVRAFNSDKRFDEFIVEQIAGDLLLETDEEDVVADRLLATGFLSLGPKVLAEPDKEKMRIDIVDEQLDVLSQAFLGQTVGCARCHDHKFDPIPITDYYAMAGIFFSTRTMETYNTVAKVLERELATSDSIDAARAHHEAVGRNKATLDEVMEEGSRALRARWIGETAQSMLASNELVSTPIMRESEDFDRSNLNINHENWGPGIGIIHTTRPAEVQFVEYDIDVTDPGMHEIHVRYASGEERPVEVHVDGKVASKDFCKAVTGSFLPDSMVWTTVEVELGPGRHVLRFQRPKSFPHMDRMFIIGPGQRATFEEETEQAAARHEIDVELLRRWAMALAAEPIFLPWRVMTSGDTEHDKTEFSSAFSRMAKGLAANPAAGGSMKDTSGIAPKDRIFIRTLVAGTPPEDIAQFAQRWQSMSQLVMDSWKRHIEKAEGEDGGGLPDSGQEALRVALIGRSGVLTLDGSDPERFPAGIRERVRALVAEKERLDETRPESIMKGIAVREDKPIDLPVFIRGDHTNKMEDTVPRRFLTILDEVVESPEIDGGTSGRLELAEWIVDPEHPLTARVAVNRAWHWHFGRGIVATPSNLGMRGSPPSHPELLDWLARHFIATGWSMKDLHRLILDSATWRMGAGGDERGALLDPDNTLRWHSPPRRLEAEPIRDAILAVSGSLDQSLGGSLLRSKGFGYVTNDQSNSNEVYTSNRRAIYMPVIRNDMYPLFATFDYTDSSYTIDARPNTMVAQQALFMLNSEMVGAQAERLAGLLIEDTALQDDRSRVERAYEICFSRPPHEQELQRALEFIDRVRETGGAPSISWPEQADRDEKVDPHLHAMRSFCQVLLASNEFIYVN